ncbi:hypothetical protein ACU21_01310 [Actinobaculum suis]|nr:hypothetical protein ACU19_08085 [Actinobaculum suis]OCA93116.1 hypothetical protein ACU21_01310 [Actinobaculum suis]OCA93242.1 hypothetical protein ACU20_02480 [Actinobaculum suis]
MKLGFQVLISRGEKLDVVLGLESGEALRAVQAESAKAQTIGARRRKSDENLRTLPKEIKLGEYCTIIVPLLFRSSGVHETGT